MHGRYQRHVHYRGGHQKSLGTRKCCTTLWLNTRRCRLHAVASLLMIGLYSQSSVAKGKGPLFSHPPALAEWYARQARSGAVLPLSSVSRAALVLSFICAPA